MELLKNVLTFSIKIGSFSISIKAILIILVVFFATFYFLKLLKRLLSKTLESEAKTRFRSIFSFFNYFIYAVVFFITLDNLGVDVKAIFVASAALLIGIGLALQTFFQDIISGIFIIIDQSVHVGDIIEVEGKTSRIKKITLRTTRTVTLDNKVLIIPNHKFLTSILYNWTENGKIIREGVSVGVAYGTDVEKVKQLLIETVLNHKRVLAKPPPVVLFTNFGDNSLDFKIFFTINNGLISGVVKSDIRFEIYKVFEQNKIEIPFPQRTVWLKK